VKLYIKKKSHTELYIASAIICITKVKFSRHLSGLDKGKVMHLLFIKDETVLPSGIPARSVLTSYYKSDHFRCRGADPYNDLTSPNEVILCPDSRQSMYCQLLSGLIHRHSILRLGAVFASALLRSITFLERNWLELTNDIRLGQLNTTITDRACRAVMSHMLQSPNPLLADEIESICNNASWRGILVHLWPKVKCIEAVLTGTMAQYIPMLEFYSGGTIPLVCTMYASSESYFGVNINPLCHPNDVSYTVLPNMAYFEFIELDNELRYGDEEEVQKEKVVDLVDVQVGRYYEIVVTTFSGKLLPIFVYIIWKFSGFLEFVSFAR
jgi:auxin responsive GH3 gene family